MSGDERRKATSSRTLSSTSENGRKSMLLESTPRSCLTLACRSRLVNVSMPQSVWWMTAISLVPSKRWEITRERKASRARPPAFRMTWASPSSRPSTREGRMRASMQVTTATLRRGHRQIASIEPAGIFGVGLKHLIYDRHVASLAGDVAGVTRRRRPAAMSPGPRGVRAVGRFHGHRRPGTRPRPGGPRSEELGCR